MRGGLAALIAGGTMHRPGIGVGRSRAIRAEPRQEALAALLLQRRVGWRQASPRSDLLSSGARTMIAAGAVPPAPRTTVTPDCCSTSPAVAERPSAGVGCAGGGASTMPGARLRGRRRRGAVDRDDRDGLAAERIVDQHDPADEARRRRHGKPDAGCDDRDARRAGAAGRSSGRPSGVVRSLAVILSAAPASAVPVSAASDPARITAALATL